MNRPTCVAASACDHSIRNRDLPDRSKGERVSHSMTASRIAIAIWMLAVIATLWFLRTASTLLIPIALAVLISYALEPAVAWLARHRVHRLFGAATVLLLVVGGLLAGAYAVRADAMRMVQAAPEAMDRAREMVAAQLGSDAAATATGALGGGSSDRGDAAGTSGEAGGSIVRRVVGAVFSFAGHLVAIVFLVDRKSTRLN